MAWIEHRSWHLRGLDWQLWIERKGRMTSAKCPLRLEIESRLRSWLLRVSGMPLNTLTYTQLRLITEGKIPEARRLHIRSSSYDCAHGGEVRRQATLARSTTGSS